MDQVAKYGYKIHHPAGTKGEVPTGPRVNSRGIMLTSGQLDEQSLIVANPEQDPAAYQQSLLRKQQDFINRVKQSRANADIYAPQKVNHSHQAV